MVAELLIQQFSFKETDLVLDVGCGDGKITAEIAEKLPYGHIIGIDPSESMINFANQTFKKNNIDFEHGKASEVSYSNQFDVITSFSSLHWEPKQEVALRCFRNALKPCGAILLLIPGPDLVLRSALKEICTSLKWEDWFRDFQSPGKIWSTNEYAKLLLDSGFIIRKIEAVDRCYAFQKEIDYKIFLESMLPHLSCLPNDRINEFLSEVIELVKIKGRLDKQGYISFDVKVLEVIAYNS